MEDPGRMNLPIKFYSETGRNILEASHFTPGSRPLRFHALLDFSSKIYDKVRYRQCKWIKDRKVFISLESIAMTVGPRADSGMWFSQNLLELSMVGEYVPTTWWEENKTEKKKEILVIRETRILKKKILGRNNGNFL